MAYAWLYLLDPSLLVMILIASCTIWYGSWRSLHFRLSLLSHKNDSEGEDNSMKMSTAILMPVVGSVFLVVLFFFLDVDVLQYLLIAVLSFSSFTSIAFLIDPYVQMMNRKLSIERRWKLRWIGDVTVSGVITILISLGLVIAWNITKWILLTDILAICLATSALSFVIIPNMKIATVLLSLFFLYDIFWVFLSAFFFRGESVMVSVATRLPSLPMLIIMPRFIFEGYSMLGVGDMVLPGIFLCYLYHFDVYKHNNFKSSYFARAWVAYIIAMFFTIFMVVATNHGQPALLYLVPATLLTTTYFGWKRGELYQLWNGIHHGTKEDIENPSRTSSEFNDRDEDKQSLLKDVKSDDVY